mgnify:CR=1 FL=1
MTQRRAGGTMDRTMTTLDRALRLADRVFRVAGIVTIGALLATIALLLRGAPASQWHLPFVAAHLAALVALLPLGAALIARAYVEAGGVSAMIARHRAVVLMLLIVAVAVTVTLLEFTAHRAVRRVSNTVTVTLVLVLVAQYLRWYARWRPGGTESR